jgi:hypothetical protein
MRSIDNIMNDYIQIAREKTGCDIILFHAKDNVKGYTVKVNDKRGEIYNVYVNMSMSTEQILTILKHELGHIVQESFKRSFLASLKMVTTEYLDKVCSKLHPNELYLTSDFADTFIGKGIINAHISLFNIMEDVRMESKDGYGRIGRADGYIKVRKSMKGSTKTLDDPASKLLATRFFDNELLPEAEQDTYMNIHESLNMQSHKGMIKIFREFCKNYYHPYLDNMLDKLKSDNDKIDKHEQNIRDIRTEGMNQTTQTNHEIDNMRDEFREAVSKCKNEDEVNKLEQDRQMKRASINSDYKKKMKALKAKEYRNKKKIKNIQNNIENMFKDQKENINGGIDSTMLNPISISEGFDKDEIDGVDLSEEKQNEIKELNTKLGISTMKNNATEIDITNNLDLLSSSIHEMVLPLKVRNEIRKTVDTVTNRKNRLMNSGDGVNLRAYLNSIQERGTKIFNRKLNKIKLSILLSVDASGSMDNWVKDKSFKKMDVVHTIVKTMMRSVKDKKEIEIKAISWGGRDAEMGYTLIDDLSKIDRLKVYSAYEQTPTVQALRKSKTILHNMRGRKKIIIFLTDGSPSNLMIGSIKTQQKETIQMCASEIKQIKTIGNIVPIFIGDDDSVMHKLFKNVINVDGDNMVDVLMRKFRKIIVDELR